MTYVKAYTPKNPDVKEILRYAGVKKNQDGSELLPLVRECTEEAADAFSYKVCYTELPLDVCGDTVTLGTTKVKSQSLAKNLSGCDSAIIFVGTVGLQIDRLIARYSSLSPSRALIFQSLGAERAEALVECFCEDMKKEKGALGYTLRPRFSAGFGDLTLSFQREIFSLLDAYRHIGVALGENMLMSPKKSVSAIIGLEKSKL